MQRIHAIDHLLERSGGNDPREHGVGVENFRGGNRKAACDAAFGAEARDQPFVGQDPACVATFGQCAAQLVSMPASPRIKNDYLHQSNSEMRSTSGSSRPPWNVRPLVALVSHTSAGLNSIGSIL